MYYFRLMLIPAFRAAGFFFIVLVFLSCESGRKPEPAVTHDFNIDSLLGKIKSDASLKADDATFDKKDSLLIVYVDTNIPLQDSGALRAHFKSYHITNAIRRAKNISGLVFVKTPPADSLKSQGFQYHILASFFKEGSRFAERK